MLQLVQLFINKKNGTLKRSVLILVKRFCSSYVLECAHSRAEDQQTGKDENQTTKHEASRLLFPNFLMGFCSVPINTKNVGTKLEVRSFTRS